MLKRFSVLALCALILPVAACSATRIDTDHMSSADLMGSPQYMGIYPVVPRT